MKVIFMGTPEFAIPSLEAIHKEGHDILCVITQPDRPKGRGMHFMPSPVKQFAQKNKLKILEPLKIKDGEKETGVTTQKMALKLDAGDILFQEKVKILESDTAGTLHDKLKAAGALTLVKTMELIK